MRVALVGASALGVATAEILIKRGHDLVIIDRDKDKIAALSEDHDCAFIHGDGTKPAILREVGPSDTALLLCLTGNDQSNILAGLVGRSLGFARVVTKIEDPEYEHICLELSLDDVIIPDRQVAQAVADMAAGEKPQDYSTFFKADVRLFSFAARQEDAGALAELDLPGRTSVMCIYRDDDFFLPDHGASIRKGDEVVLVTHRNYLDKLRERWGQRGP